MTKNQLITVKTILKKIIRKLINKGCTKFIYSFSNDTDLVFASIINSFKKNHKDLFLEAALPCQKQLKNKKFIKNLELCNGICIVESENKAKPQNKLNYCMLNGSDILIAVWDGRRNSTIFDALQQANELEKKIIIIPIKQYLYIK